jgi:hypothetical protein
MEPATHDDLWASYLKLRPQLGAAVRMFIGRAEPSADLLEFNDAYACAMARSLYLRVPQALPVERDLPGQAHYVAAVGTQLALA